MSEKESELEKSLTKLEEAINKQNSFRSSFWRGVFNGFGFFVGSAILTAVLILILAKLPDTNPIGHFLHSIVDVVNENRK